MGAWQEQINRRIDWSVHVALSELISASMITVCNGASSARLSPSLAVEPFENVCSVSAMPAGLTKHDCVVNTVCKSQSANKVGCRNSIRGKSVPRIGALWCASCPLRPKSGMIPKVIRHTEQRGRGRLQNGQAVAFICKEGSVAPSYSKYKRSHSPCSPRWRPAAR